jgi:hypothetical protein
MHVSIATAWVLIAINKNVISLFIVVLQFGLQDCRRFSVFFIPPFTHTSPGPLSGQELIGFLFADFYQ